MKWGNSCFPGCFPHLPQPVTPLPVHSTSIESPVEQQSIEIPACYAPFSDIFCPKRASSLPPHWPWDCAIDLLPDEPVAHRKIYPLSLPEQKVMEEYVKEARQPFHFPCCFQFFFSWQRRAGACSPA